MSGPKKSSSSSRKTTDVLAYVERLRQEAEKFEKTVEKEIRLARAQLVEARVPQVKKRS